MKYIIINNKAPVRTNNMGLLAFFLLTKLYLLLFVADWNGQSVDHESIAEIYMHKKDWPGLEAGNVISVSGEISRSGSLPRVKIKSTEQIWPNDQIIELNEPDIIELDDISEESHDSWQKIRGIVAKKSGKNVYLSVNVEEDAILRIYNKFSIKDLNIQKGQEIIATGILQETDNLMKLTVFAPGDLLVSKEVLGEKIIDSGPKNSTNSSKYNLVNKKKANNPILFVLTGALLLIIIYFINSKYLKRL